MQQQQHQKHPQRQRQRQQRQQQYPSCSPSSSSVPAPPSSTATAVRLLPRPTLSSDAPPSLASSTPTAHAHAHAHVHRMHDVASPMSVAAVPSPPPPTPASGTPSATAPASASASASASVPPTTASVTARASTPTPTQTSTGQPLRQPVKKRNKGKQPKWRDLDSLAAVMCILDLSKVPGMATNTGGISTTGATTASSPGNAGTGGTKQRRVDFHNQLKLEFDQRAHHLGVTDARILEIWQSRSGRSIAEQGNKAIVACRRLKAVFDSIRDAHLDDATRMRCAVGLFNEVVNESQFGDIMSNRNYFIGKPFPYPLTFQWLSENTKELLVDKLVPSADVNNVNNINTVNNNNNNNTNNKNDDNENVVNEYVQKENPGPPTSPPQPLQQQASAPIVKSDDDARPVDTHEHQQIHMTKINGGRRCSATLRAPTNAPVINGHNDDNDGNNGDDDDNNNNINAASPSQHSASDKSMKTSPAKAASARDDDKDDGLPDTMMFQLAMRALKDASMASTRGSDRRAKLQTDLAEQYLQMRKKADEMEALKVLFDDDSEESKQYKKILQRRRLRELMRADEQEAREEREERDGIGLRKKRKAGNHCDANESQQPMGYAANGNSPDVMFTFE